MRSPIHQAVQARPALAAAICPPSRPLVTPMLAPNIVLSSAASITRATTSRTRCNEG